MQPQNDSPTDARDEQVGIPLGLSPATTADEEETSSPGGLLGRLPELAHSNLVLVVLVAAGLLGVYLLSLRSGPTRANASTQQAELSVDAALRRMTRGAGTDSSSIVESFRYEAKHRQVPLDEVVGNPFAFIPPQERNIAPLPDDLARRLQDDQRRLAAYGDQAAAELDKLTLQSILAGSGVGVAVINDEVVTTGQTIEGWTIGRILPDRVELTWHDRQHWLTLR